MWFLAISDGAVTTLIACAAVLIAGFGAWIVVNMGKQAVETAKLGGSNEALAQSVGGLAEIVRELKDDYRGMDDRLRRVEIGNGRSHG